MSGVVSLSIVVLLGHDVGWWASVGRGKDSWTPVESGTE